MSVASVRRSLDRPMAAVAEREFRTAIRNRGLVALSVGFVAVVLGVAWTGGVAGYLPLALNLLTPVEVLVPALAIALAYRSILSDRRQGELAMVRTYPVSRATYVLGVYLGRAALLLVVVLVALTLAGVLVPAFGGAKSSVLATHQGMDSAVLYVRFVVLTAAYALVVLAAGVLVSAVAGTGRVAVALGVGALLLLVVGIDLGIVAGLATGLLGGDLLEVVLAISPNSAYRGLVLGVALDLTSTAGVVAANPVASALGLAAWWLGALLLATRAVWRAV